MYDGPRIFLVHSKRVLMGWSDVATVGRRIVYWKFYDPTVTNSGTLTGHRIYYLHTPKLQKPPSTVRKVEQKDRSRLADRRETCRDSTGPKNPHWMSWITTRVSRHLSSVREFVSPRRFSVTDPQSGGSAGSRPLCDIGRRTMRVGGSGTSDQVLITFR